MPTSQLPLLKKCSASVEVCTPLIIALEDNPVTFASIHSLTIDCLFDYLFQELFHICDDIL